MMRRLPLLLAAVIVAYVWLTVIGPVGMIAVAAIGLAVLAGKPLGMRRRR